MNYVDEFSGILSQVRGNCSRQGVIKRSLSILRLWFL